MIFYLMYSFILHQTIVIFIVQAIFVYGAEQNYFFILWNFITLFFTSSMSSKEFKCPLCHFQYNKQVNTPRLLTMCGHTFCQKCVKSLIVKKKDMKYKIRCPEDNCCLQFQSGKPTHFPKNLALLQVIGKNKKSSMTLPQQSFDVSHIKQIKTNESQVEGDITGKQFLQIIGQLENKKFSNSLEDKINSIYSDKNKFQDYDEKNFCSSHQKVKDVICIEHMKKICANCAIFGQHKGHSFKSIAQVQKQSDESAFHLQKLLQQKQIFENNLTNQKKYQQQIITKLSHKTQTLKSQIRQFYLKLLQNIEKSERQIIKQIQIIASDTLNKLKIAKNAKKDNMIAYNKWQFLTKIHLEILQSNATEQKCQIVFGQQSIINNLIAQGQQLGSHNSIQSQEIANSEKNINGLELIINKQIFQLLETCISIKTNQQNQNKLFLMQRNKSQNLSAASYRSRIKSLHYQDGLLEQSIIQQQKQEDTQKNITQKVTSDIVENAFGKTSLIHTDQQKTLVMEEKNKKFNKKKTLSSISPCPFPITERINFPNNMKKSSLPILKMPQKYEKLMKLDQSSKLEYVDITNAKLPQNMLLEIILSLPKYTKIKSLKLCRNNISDRFLQKIIDCLGEIISLNLSQNFLTDNSLKLIASKLVNLPNLKVLNLSQNKIVERRNKTLIEQMRSHGLSLTI